jgi:hypothetical protein
MNMMMPSNLRSLPSPIIGRSTSNMVSGVRISSYSMPTTPHAPMSATSLKSPVMNRRAMDPPDGFIYQVNMFICLLVFYVKILYEIYCDLFVYFFWFCIGI